MRLLESKNGTVYTGLVTHGNDYPHIDFMRRALFWAEKAAEIGEVPVGAVLVGPDGKIWAEGHNQKETSADPTGHAEIVVLQTAARERQAWRLIDSTLYVTLEPCAMCAGALVNARVKRLVFGAHDPKAGAVRSMYQIADDPRLNHRLEIISGVLATECSSILKDFFLSRRGSKSSTLFNDISFEN